MFVWYLHHSLPVTPINPHSASIDIPPDSRELPLRPRLEPQYPTAPSLSALATPQETAVSIITPPKVTLQVLAEAKRGGIKAVWLQPGSFDMEGLKFARQEFQVAIGGFQGLPKTKGEEGWCILVDGEQGLSLVRRDGQAKGERL